MNISPETILAHLGYASLTAMQKEMLLTASRDDCRGVVLLSPTGSGKTLAYLLPLLKYVDPSLETLQAVVIVPTRELAAQSEDVLKRMRTGIKSLALYGGRPTMQEHRVIREVHPQVVFSTPGRLNDHLDKENLHYHGVRLVVLDEFDKCLELGFTEEMERAVSRLQGSGRCWLLSATEAEAIPSFMSRIVKDGYQRLDFLASATKNERRTKFYRVHSPEKDKLATLGLLLTHLLGAQTIIFVAHRESVERVGEYLRKEGFYTALYHGGMEQEKREQALYRFRNGSANILVSTDLAARGLDIPEVESVIHYHLPLKAEDFTHRSGRTARWESEGAVYLLTGPTENLPEFIKNTIDLPLKVASICPAVPKYATIYIGKGKRDKLSKGDIVGFFCKQGGLNASEIGRIDVGSRFAFVAVPRQKVKSVLSLVASEKIKGMKTLIEESSRR